MPRSAVAALTFAMLAIAAPTGAPLAAQPARVSVDSTWRRDGVCYEIFVRSFYDSDGDGVGDLNGITQKLDYINDGDARSTRSLGANCIWLMPVAASPSYHGYDVTNYYRVNPQYGTNADFKRFVAQAHRRGIRVLVDLVLNHASSEHPFFKAALRDTASPYRSWFRFSPTRPSVTGPWGQQVWHKSRLRDEYYYGIFTAGMPDLNYENPAVRAEAAKVGRFWLTEMGVDGFRLDAVPYLVEESGALAHTRGTHGVLRDFAAEMRRVRPGAFTIGEVWDSTGVVLPYYPDQLDGYFAFELSDALLDAVRTGTAARLLPPFLRLQKALPATRWSPFLRNHDQTRTVTALGGDVAAARLAAELLLTLPGLPFVYYGEEIGMGGDKPDPRLRTPMQWGPERGARFTTGEAWEPLQPDSLRANVADQERDASSILRRYRQLIHLRSSHPALGRGELVPLESSDPAVVAYLRRDEANAVLVVSNLGKAAASSVTISSGDGAVRTGRYAPRDLLSGESAVRLDVAGDGRLRAYAPAASLAPRRTLVLHLRRDGR
jgi:alpha-amylase